LVLIGIHGDPKREEALAAMKSAGVTYPNAIDDGERTQEAYEVPGYPTYVLIDREGVVREYDPEDLEAAVERMLARK
jgi:hypothetical protein